MPYGDNPAADTGDRLRLLIGDTDPNDPILSDNEVAYYLSEYGSPLSGALEALYDIKTKSSYLTNESVGSTSKSLGQLVDNIDKAIASLELKRDRNTPVEVYAGGISKTNKEFNESNTDRVEPFFTRHTHDSDGVEIEANR